MRPNPLVDALPTAWRAPGGELVEADTSHFCGIRCSLLLDDPAVGWRAKAALVAANVLAPGMRGNEAAASTPEAAEWCLRFVAFGDDPRAPGRRAVRAFSFDDDADRVIADFQREYGIDLTDRGRPIHWWRFGALLRGLSGDSEVSAAVRLRTEDVDPRLPEDVRRRMRKAKDAVRLAPRTRGEAMAASDEAWGVG